MARGRCLVVAQDVLDVAQIHQRDRRPVAIAGRFLKEPQRPFVHLAGARQVAQIGMDHRDVVLDTGCREVVAETFPEIQATLIGNQRILDLALHVLRCAEQEVALGLDGWRARLAKHRQRSLAQRLGF